MARQARWKAKPEPSQNVGGHKGTKIYTTQSAPKQPKSTLKDPQCTLKGPRSTQKGPNGANGIPKVS